MAVLILLLTAQAVKAQTITGTVFRDFNSNGAYEAAPASGTFAYGEVGVPGVVVTAYPITGSPKSATTSSAGSYTITGLTGQVRLEFSNLTVGDFDSFRGSGSATSVQFVTAGSTANYGINYPANYCQTTSPQLITTCFVAINAENKPELGKRDAMVGVPYDVIDKEVPVSEYAIVNEIGAAWGLAYKKSTKQMFSTAFTKRHVGFAAGGPNAIYVTSVTSGTGNTTQFFNFTTVGGGAVSTAAETHGNDIPTALNANGRLDSYDIPAFDAVGKTSLGDIDISDDDKTLYVVNLKDRKLYTIDIATKAAVGIAIPSPCGTQSYRPFAVKYYRGKTYVGVVCTREDLNLDANGDRVPDSYGPTTGLSATVYEFNGSTFTSVLSFPLTYKKQPTNADVSGQARAEYWRPWSAEYQTDRLNTSYPQAWLTDIEFDVDGDMIVGLRDRFGDQMGFQNRRPIAGDALLVSAISPGEVLRARKCTPTATTWTLENGGSLCGETPSASQAGQQGPGDGKYYWGDRVQNGGNHGTSSMAGLALLAGSGKLAMTAIDPLDVFNTGGIKRMINETGAKDGNATGTALNPGAGYSLYGSDAFGYGKANGLGDLEVLCDPAPVQIGNRVWVDTNNNGVQDPGEAPLPGVQVTLKGPGLPTAGATVTTNANGEYYFANATGTNATGFVYSLTGLVSGGAYTLTFPTSASANALSLSSKPNSATGTNADAIDTDPDAAGVVSFTLGQSGQNNFTYDAGYVPVPPCSVSLTITSVVCNTATNRFTVTGSVSFTSAGQSVTVADGAASTVVSATGTSPKTFTLTGTNLVSNASSHTLTATSSATASCVASQTYTAPASCTIGLAGLGDYVFLDANKDGIQNAGDTPIGGVTVTLYINGVASATTTTASSGSATGFYSFTGLTPGNSLSYSVGFTAPAGYTATLQNIGNDALDSDADPVTGRTQSITLASAEFDPTLDAGFYLLPPPATAGLGDFVFEDTNKNGQQDTGEPGIPNVTVTLLSGTTVVGTTATNGSGLYSFTGLTPGTPYSVSFTAPTGYTATGQNIGNDATDSDGDATGLTGVYSLTAGEFNPTIDMGYFTASPVVNPTLNLEKFVDKSRAERGAILTYTLVLTNTGSVSATTTVQDKLSGGSSYVPNSVSAPAGTTFTPGTPTSTWQVPVIGVGQSLTLTFQAKADSSGILYNTASIPGDTARVCTSVPVHMCVGDEYAFTLTAAPGRSSYRWFKDNVEIAGQTTNVLEVTAPGTYSLAVDNVTGQCPDFSCCPFVVVEDTLPRFVAAATPATCVGSTPQNNGSITLSQFTPGNTYQYSLGTEFNQAASLSGPAQVIPAGGVIVSNLASPVAATSYTVRVYNASGCYTDVTVLLLPTVCGCPAEICVPFVIQQTKRGVRIGEAR